MPEELREKSNFIWEAIKEDLAAGKAILQATTAGLRALETQ